MRSTTHETENPAAGLLSLVEGGDMGAVLLRLAHRAAAQHRFEAVHHAVDRANNSANTDAATNAQRAGGTP